VIGPVYDEDADDIGEPDAAGLSWFDCRILPPAEMLETIKRQGSLDGRSVNLYRALERPRTPI
jgi:hypothetical protein